jgi:hypothetical protein
MPAASVHAIFWGGGWSNPGDKITGLDTYYQGFGTLDMLTRPMNIPVRKAR